MRRLTSNPQIIKNKLETPLLALYKLFYEGLKFIFTEIQVKVSMQSYSTLMDTKMRAYLFVLQMRVDK